MFKVHLGSHTGSCNEHYFSVFKQKLTLPVLDKEVHQMQRGLIGRPYCVVQCRLSGFLQGAIKHSLLRDWAASILLCVKMCVCMCVCVVSI